MTYAQFIEESRKCQLDYIKRERAKMAKAARLWERYRKAMLAMGLHPLNGCRISDRMKELDQMKAEAPQCYSDTPAMRASYDLHCFKIAA